MPQTRSAFERRLLQLRDTVLLLGSMAHSGVARAVQALVDDTPDLAREVTAADASINRLRFEIEADCYRLLATEQPVARDMRAIAAALTMAMELERIGDHGKKIARIHLRMTQEGVRPDSLEDIVKLSESALGMMRRALDAIATGDVAEARAVCQADDEIDALYRRTFEGTLSRMVADPSAVTGGTHLIQIAHELERVGDRSTNIAERVIYAVTGELIELNS